MKTLRNWFVGVMLLILFPIIIPLGTVWALVYKIPQTLGSWIFAWIESKDEVSRNE